MIQADKLPLDRSALGGSGHSHTSPEREEALGREQPSGGCQALQPSASRAAFLLELSDRLLELEDPQAIVSVSLEALGSHLQTELAGYCEVDPGGKIATRQEWTQTRRGNPASLRLDDFPGGPEALATGRIASVSGTGRETAAPQEGANVTVPLLRNGELVALLYLRESGERIWTAEELSLAENVAQRILRAVERARSDAALRESEARFRTMTDAQPALVWIIDPALELVYANARWRAFSGLPPEQSLGYSWMEAVHPDDIPSIMERVERMRGNEVPVSFEIRYRTIAGEYRWHMIQAEPVRNARGELTAWFGASVDIHDQKLAEAALRESEERLSLAQRAAGIGVFDWEIPTGRVTWSPEQERLFGLEPDTFEGTIDGWTGRVHPDDLGKVQQGMTEAIARQDREVVGLYRACKPDGATRFIHSVGTFVYGPDGAALRLVGVNIDITERKEAEERQHLLIRELHHRVKNTLATVQAVVSATSRTATSMEEFYQGFLGRIISLARTHNLLTEDDWQKVSLGELLHNELDPYEDGGERRIVLRGPSVELSSETAVPIGMAIHELTTNAAKHGALSVSTGRVEVCWQVADAAEGAELAILWTEHDGPPVTAPTRHGFGSRLLQRVLTTQLQAQVQIAYDPDGMRFSMTMPLPTATALLNPLS